MADFDLETVIQSIVNLRLEMLEQFQSIHTRLDQLARANTTLMNGKKYRNLDSNIELDKRIILKALSFTDTLAGDCFILRKYYTGTGGEDTYQFPLKVINRNKMTYFDRGDWKEILKTKLMEKIAFNLQTCYTSINKFDDPDISREQFLTNQNRITQLMKPAYRKKLLQKFIENSTTRV